MSDTGSSHIGALGRSEGHWRVLGAAWLSFTVLLVAVPIGRWASAAFLAAQGYDVIYETEPPGLGLLSFLLFVAIVGPPAVVALVAGERASRLGHRSALVVLVVAGLVSGLLLLGLPVYLSRLIGWPLALLLVAGLVAVGWFSRPGRWGRAARRPVD